jgi:hypothetical protein
VNRRLIFLLIGVLAIKAIFLVLDPNPSVHSEGSAVYLATAIGKWIPPDHGFVYGLLLRPIAVWPRSLMPMVLTQAALSGIASWLIGVCLVRYFAAGFVIAAVCSFACAIEPLQLAAERYVSTESIATFVFALFLLAAFSYLKTSSLSTLALVQILGALLVTLQLTLLPIALAMSIVLPVLSRRAISFWRSWRRFGIKWINGLRFIVTPLLVSLLLSQTLLHAYRHLYGALLDKPPAYTYRTEKLARSTYAEYFDQEKLRSGLELERRQFVDALPGETQAIKVALGMDVQKPSFASLTERWEERSVVWCSLLVILPLLFLIYLAIKWRRIRAPHLVCGLCGLLLLQETVEPAEYASPRHLVTLAWLAFLMIGCIAGSVLGRVSKNH